MTEQMQDHPNVNKNIHPPLVAVFYLVLAYFLKWLVPIPYVVPDILRYTGLGLVIIGFCLGAGAFIEFRKAHTTLDPHGSVKAVVTTGIYRFTRNPIYLGFLLIIIGLPLNAGTFWGIVVSPFFVVTLNLLVIEREESYLKKKFGEVYINYKLRVRRWL